MKSGIFRWIVLALAVWIAAAIVPGIRYDDGQSLVLAALVLSVLNTFVKPVLNVLSLPFIVLTLGLFLLVVRAYSWSMRCGAECGTVTTATGEAFQRPLLEGASP